MARLKTCKRCDEIFRTDIKYATICTKCYIKRGNQNKLIPESNSS